MDLHRLPFLALTRFIFLPFDLLQHQKRFVAFSASFINLCLSLCFLFSLSVPEHGTGPAPVSPALHNPKPNNTSECSQRSLLNRTACGAMLSGTWRRSVGQTQSTTAPVVNTSRMTLCGVPSGTVVLEAQYDYNYRGADGRQVSIREGERFILLKKTNADWWQVRKYFIFFVFLVLVKH